MMTDKYEVGDLVKFHEDIYAMVEDPNTGSMMDCVLGSGDDIIGIVMKISTSQNWTEVEVLADGDILVIPDPHQKPELILLGEL